jgi:hypothetical protein
MAVSISRPTQADHAMPDNQVLQNKGPPWPLQKFMLSENYINKSINAREDWNTSFIKTFVDASKEC